MRGDTPDEEETDQKRRRFKGPRRFFSAFHPLTRGDRNAIGGLFTGFWEYLKTLRTGRSVPEGYDFNKMLIVWGIRPDQVERVRKMMLVESLGFGALALTTVFAAIIWPAVRAETLQCGLVLLVCLLGFLTRLWRFDLLRREEWVPFRRWLFGG